MKRHRLTHMAATLLVAILTTGCDHKEFRFNLPFYDVNVSYDWALVPDAQPASMRLTAYREYAQPAPFPSAGREGTAVSLRTGRYDFVAHNSDTEVFDFGGPTWDSYEITCKETRIERSSPMFSSTRAVPLGAGTVGQPVVLEPEPLWTSSASGVSIDADHSLQLVFPMESPLHEYVFTIADVENLQYAREIMMTISGVSSSYYPASRRCSDTHCIIPFPAENTGTSTVSGRVRLFGHCPEGEVFRHVLVIYVELRDGAKWYYTADVTAAMHDPDHITSGGTGQTDVPIVIDRLPLPEPITNGSGLHPTVDEWQEIKIDVPM